LWVDLDNAEHICQSLDLPGCRLALRVDRIVRSADGVVLTHDVRYFISSLDPNRVKATELLQYVRQHWRLENGLHFLKDRWWDEDRHHTRRPGLSACLAALNNAALSIHRLCFDGSQPIRAAADHIAWNPTRGLQILNT
jgi:predicted transposase YbfD/YdcC